MSRKPVFEDGVLSTARCTHLESDKSRTPFSVGLLKFYSLHKTLYNIDEERRRKQILNGKIL